MTLGKLFNLCQDIELRQAKLYASLSLLLGGVDERIARFWERMSTEEWQHYILVDFGRSLCAETFGTDLQVMELPDVARRLPANIGKTIQQITEALDVHERKVNSGQITLDEAFAIAVAIEGSEADTLYMYLLAIIRKAIHQSDQPYLMSRVVQVEKDMVSHVDGLVQATQRFSQDASLIRRAHRLKAHHN